jgi:AcrR family transcriptional regulator
MSRHYVPGVSATRLRKPERREQLLDAALGIAREEGTDALTLARVAERAGVTKPIAYEHFGTRSQLLIAICRRLDEKQVATLHEESASAPRRLRDVARIMSAAYMSCYASVGPEWHRLTGALQGDEEMTAYLCEVNDAYVAIFRAAVAPYCRLDDEELRLRCVGILGAAEAISRDMLTGRITEAAATATLAAMFVASVGAK